VLHISIWAIEAFSGVLSGDGSEFWALCDSVGPQIGGMECGWYGSGNKWNSLHETMEKMKT